MITKILQADLLESIEQGAELLRAGKLVAFPTDTVYGLAADAFNSKAIEALFMVKDREFGKAIAVLVGSQKDLARVSGRMTGPALRLAEHFWPGPLTLVVSKHASLPEILSPLPTVGIRMPDHPAALALLRLTGPLAVTSANQSGSASTCTAGEVLAQLGNRIPLILDGGTTPGGIPSTVIDCSRSIPVILRQGPISEEAIRKFL